MSASVSLTFPDGSIREYAAGTTGAQVAESISKSLAKKAVAIALDGTVRDLSAVLPDIGPSTLSPTGMTALAHAPTRHQEPVDSRTISQRLP